MALVMSEITNCVMSRLPSVLSKNLGIDEARVRELIETGRIKASTTPDPRLGDFGIAIHVLLRNIDQGKWIDVGSKIAEDLYVLSKETCWVERIVFVNGYINVYIDHFTMLYRLVESFTTSKIYEELHSVGKGLKVIVEHTSANPVHPLHIGSGRNSVIGDTYARLLRKLGFNVETRYYVNDLGRQVATLVYGVSITDSNGLTKPPGIKTDHWYGVIYALTNILIELSRIRSEMRDKITELLDKADRLCQERSNDKLPREILLSICELSWKRSLKSEFLKHSRNLYRLLRKWKEVSIDPELRELYSTLEYLRKLAGEYLEYSRAEKKLSMYYPDLYNVLKSAIKNHVEAEKEITRLMYLAESEDPSTLSLFREVSSRVLEGFVQSLRVIGVEFNGFDFESSSVVLRRAHEIVDEVAKTSFARVVSGGALEVDLNTLASVDERVKKLFYPDQAGRFIIRRSDGTTLYVTRDIAYSIYKFKDLGASVVYNVIAVEQSREQKQLKAMLYLLGYPEYAENMHHFAYEMVHLKGMRMSGRRGVYYTIDEMVIDAKLKILSKLLEKTPISEIDMVSVAEKLAIANTRAILLSVEPGKVLVFDPEKIDEIEYGTIIEYSFVRSLGIIRNLWGLEFLENPEEVYSRALKTLGEARKVEISIEEKKLVEDLLRFKSTLIEAYREMKPNKILEYAVTISLDFNKFYEKYPIITERDEDKRRARILIAVLSLSILSELLDILGFPKLSMM